jgi:hypothetical protein
VFVGRDHEDPEGIARAGLGDFYYGLRAGSRFHIGALPKGRARKRAGDQGETFAGLR